MTSVILPKSARQREICCILATNVKTLQNYIKWCILISISFKETVTEQMHAGSSLDYISLISGTPYFIGITLRFISLSIYIKKKKVKKFQ